MTRVDKRDQDGTEREGQGRPLNSLRRSADQQPAGRCEEQERKEGGQQLNRKAVPHDPFGEVSRDRSVRQSGESCRQGIEGWETFGPRHRHWQRGKHHECDDGAEHARAIPITAADAATSLHVRDQPAGAEPG